MKTNSSSFGRICFGLAIAGLGVAHLVAADFVTRILPMGPTWRAWMPGRALCAGLLGLGLLAAGATIAVGRRGKQAAALSVGALIAVSLLFLYLPLIAARPGFGGSWTNPCKYLAILGGALLIAAPGNAERQDRLARFLLGGFMVLGGIQHFVYAEFVATLVPAWIPGAAFWAAFAGVALIAGGIGLQAARTARLATLLSGAMIFTWFLILHIPRAVGLGNAGEWSAVFESLAMAGIAFVIAGRQPAVVGAVVGETGAR